MDNNDFDFRLQPGLSSKTVGKSSGEAPLLSIITPYYEAWKYFPQTFQGVLNQSFPYWEWIIVDDGSKTDVDKLRELIKSEPRVKLLRQENKGPSSARNLALQHIRTELIVPLDADDLLAGTFLECAYWTMQTHPEAGWAYSDSVGFGEKNYLWTVPFSSDFMKIKNDLVLTSCIRKQVLDIVEGFDEKIKYGYEDWQLWLSLLSNGVRPLHMSWYGFWYRRSSVGVLSKAREDDRATRRMIYAASKLVPKHIKAIEFPRITEELVSSIETFVWERLLSLPTGRKRLLFILDDMQDKPSNQILLRLLDCFKDHDYHTGILSTHPAYNTLRQELEAKASETFDLPSFLELRDWTPFIRYYIQTRQVNLIVFFRSTFGYYLLPWLRQEFPSVSFIDLMEEADRKGELGRLSAAVNVFLDKSYTIDRQSPVEISKEWQALMEQDGIHCQHTAEMLAALGTFPAEIGLLYQRYCRLKLLPDAAAVRERYYVQLLKRIMHTPVFRFFLHLCRG